MIRAAVIITTNRDVPLLSFFLYSTTDKEKRGFAMVMTYHHYLFNNYIWNIYWQWWMRSLKFGKFPKICIDQINTNKGFFTATTVGVGKVNRISLITVGKRYSYCNFTKMEA